MKNPDRELAKQILYYAQEVMLDVATTGKEAKDRAAMNAELMKEAVEAWISYRGWLAQDLLKEVWPKGNPRLKPK